MRSSVSSVERGPSMGALSKCVASFTEKLLSQGYAALTMRDKRTTAIAFARWVARRRLDVRSIDEDTVERFLAGHRRDRWRPAGQRRTLADFLEHLRATRVTLRPEPEGAPSPAALLQEHYGTYLRAERALAEGTIALYGRFASEFLGTRPTTSAPGSNLSAQDARDFLLDRSRTLAPPSLQLVATGLRSFLRFLFLQGTTALDLSGAVPTVARWRHATVPPYLGPEEVERLLARCDRATARGRRDHAILLLLARLGMRAAEVAALEIDDLRWRGGEILVRGKGPVLDRLPLLPDVGAAVTLYLRHDRPQSPCRRVFLRNRAPRVGLNREGVSSVVRRALDRVGLHPARRGSHLLRHSLATTMIRRGASMAEIAEVLRHRSPDTTEIYAKVDFAALRAVALPWPGSAGAL